MDSRAYSAIEQELREEYEVECTRAKRRYERRMRLLFMYARIGADVQPEFVDKEWFNTKVKGADK